MPITRWIAILLLIMSYLPLKQYETRMVLFAGGATLCCISLRPVAGLNAFAKTRTNGALVTTIWIAAGLPQKARILLQLSLARFGRNKEKFKAFSKLIETLIDG